MKLLMLIMLVANPNGEPTRLVMDYDLTLTDCGDRLLDYRTNNPNIDVFCTLQED